jgi:HEAT repeat protein
MFALTYQGTILFGAAGVVITLGLAMFLFILIRKLKIRIQGRNEERLASRIHDVLLQWLDGDIEIHALHRQMSHFDRNHILALIQAIYRVESDGRTDVRVRLRDTEFSESLIGALDPQKDRWARAAAARALGILAADRSLPPLVQTLDDKDSDVAYAAASAIADLGTAPAAEALLDRVGTPSPLNNARVVTFVEAMSCDLRPLLTKMLARGNPVATFWALGLVGEKRVAGMIEEIKPFLANGDPNVRAAVAECVGLLGLPRTDRWLEPLLDDAAWFVRCHAAKALGAMNASWAAERITGMLSDREWWCRHNAVEALVSLGSGAHPALESLLERSEDRFARNSAVEALERSGWFETALADAARGDDSARRLLRMATQSGGIGYIENALTNAPEAALSLVLDLLEEMGDRISWGRIRRAINLKLLPEGFVPRAAAVAESLQRA